MHGDHGDSRCCASEILLATDSGVRELVLYPVNWYNGAVLVMVEFGRMLLCQGLLAEQTHAVAVCKRTKNLKNEKELGRGEGSLMIKKSSLGRYP